MRPFADDAGAARVSRRRALVAIAGAGALAAGAAIGSGLALRYRRGAQPVARATATTLPRPPGTVAATRSAGLVPVTGAGPTAPATSATSTLAQTIGQLFMVGLSSDATAADLAAVQDAIQTYHAGNLVLFGTNWSSAALVQSKIAALQTTARAANGVDLLVSGNQEGGQQGSFQAFYGTGFDPIPAALDQPTQFPDPLQLRVQAKIWASQLRQAGVNLDLAPVLDTVPANLAATNDPIGHWRREYGSDPGTVMTYGVSFEQGMHDAGVAVAIKHFPGLGRVTGNTDFTAQGIVDSDFSGAGDPYLQPYQAGIHAGAELVMVSLARYPRVDPQNQAVFSPAIMRDLLRGSLGFQGLVISDDVGAAAAVADRSPTQRALDFFHAGGDILLTVQAEQIAEMTQALLSAAQNDAAFAAQLTQSAVSVADLKNRLPAFAT